MTEYVNRQEVIDALQAPEMFGITPYHIELIKQIPTVDAAPVVHGSWVPFHSQAAGDIWYCSACEIGFAARVKYCPNCGARMDAPSNLADLETSERRRRIKALHIKGVTD